MRKIFASLVLALGLNATQAGTVVVGNPSAAPLTKAQVEDIFLGKNLAVTPIDQTEGSPIRDQFYTKATGRDAAQVKATWSRITFSGKGQPPKAVPDAAAVKKAVAADPKAVGYIDAAAVDATVKVLLTLD
jgi:ABC-type phosphate transport system substrate-binding protein